MIHKQWPLSLKLLNQGADITFKKDENGCNVLHLVVLAEQVEILRMLVQKDINPDVCDDRNETPLHYAVRKKSVEMVELLLDRGANKCALNKDRITPLALVRSLRPKQMNVEDVARFNQIERLFIN